MAEGLQHAGEFKIDMCELITSTGMRIDLKTTVMGLTLYEDIFSLTVSGTIVVSDPVNMVSHGPIIGQEYLYLKIHTPSFRDKSGVIDFSKNVFLVHSVSAREKLTNGTQVFSLNFVSQELVKNQRLKVMRSFTASWSDIVKKMLTDTSYLDSKKDIVIEPSAGIKKFVSPNIRTLDVVKLATKQAVSTFKGESTYLFYETLKGFNFRTLASMYNISEQLEYTTNLPGTNIDNKTGSVDVLRDLSTILNYNIVSNNDNIVNYRNGMYGSKLIVHDIVGKNYTTDLYNYHDNFKNEHHIVGGVTAENQEFPLASDLYVNEKSQRVSDFFARTFLMPTAAGSGKDASHASESNNTPYLRYDPENWVQSRNSQMIQLENAFNVNIEVHGNTLINVGDKVAVNLPYTGVIKGNSQYDKIYRGPFLIKTIRHDFNVLAKPAKHTMYMNLVKDSLEEQLDAPDDNYEPNQGQGKTEEYSYTD